MLIQTMVSFMRKQMGPHWERTAPEVKIDGIYTAALSENIKYFQKHGGRRKVVQDGIVSPMRTGRLDELLPTFSNGRISTL